jgi:diguanylate cyclase (GGDEF)-like protein
MLRPQGECLVERGGPEHLHGDPFERAAASASSAPARRRLKTARERVDAREVRRHLLDTLRATPTAALTLGLAYLAAGLACLLAAAFPMSPQAPVRLGLAVGVASLAAGAGLALAGRRAAPCCLQVALFAANVTSAVLIANSHTVAGVLASANALPWLGVWAAVFLPRRRAFAHIAVGSAGLVAGMVIAGVPGSAGVGGLVAVTTWALALGFSLVTARVLAHLETDPLTGFLNRTGLLRAAAAARVAATRRGEPVTVTAIDLDDFKGVNDRYGHAAGDRLLSQLGRAWAPELRDGDLLGRQGGDEFVLVLPSTARDGAGDLLERLRASTDVAWTAGVSEWHADEDFEDCLERADRALYDAKRRRGPGERTQHAA